MTHHQKLAVEILSLAMSIPSEVADVNVEYSAHASGCLDVRIFRGGWRADKGPDESFYCYLKTGLLCEGLEPFVARLRELAATEVKLENQTV